jgi:hypothetical protein
MHLGSGIAVLWQSSDLLVTGARQATQDDWVYYEWQTMLADTRERLVRNGTGASVSSRSTPDH